MPKTKTKAIPVAEENIFQKEKRLKSRKAVYTQTYVKGIFLLNKDQLIEWIKQNDVLIRMVKSGVLDDDSEFCNITVEGFKAKHEH